MSEGRDLHVMVVAGEPSGDSLGGELMAALRNETGGAVRFTGMGGEAMEAQGLKSLFSIDDTSIMGLREVIPAIPTVLRRVREISDIAMAERPDVLVLIDSPDFTHRIARRLSKLAPEIVTVKYVAPQVWASRPKRAAKLAEFVDHLLCLLPFEPPYFEREGLAATFVGHPVVERVVKSEDGGAAFRERHGIGPNVPLLLVLPGSRKNEIRLMLPIHQETAALVREHVPDLQTVIPAVSYLEERIREATKDWPGPLHIVGQNEKFASFEAANAALATSGTVTTELALAQVPMVVGYQLGWLSAFVADRYFESPYITLINLIQKRGVIPEFLQDAATPDVLADELVPLLTDPEAAAAQQAEQYDALVKMGYGGDSPSLRAAHAVVAAAKAGPSKTKLSFVKKTKAAS